MLETLSQVKWQELFDESDHTYLFLADMEGSYNDVPEIVRELADGDEEKCNELYEIIFGEMPHDMDGKLFELVLPFLWEIFLETEEDANRLALNLIEEGYCRFYQMACDEMALTMGENGIEQVPAKLLGNTPAAAFAKLKMQLMNAEDEDRKIQIVNILSFLPDYLTETITLFQTMLGTEGELLDAVLLSALGRLLYRNQLALTDDFQNYLEDASNQDTQGIAAFWTLRLGLEEAPRESAQLLLAVPKNWLNELRDHESGAWYYADYIETEPSFPSAFMKKVRELAAS